MENIQRVAGYCRINCDSEENKVLYKLQCNHLRNMINSNPNMTLVDIYGDYDVPGTSKNKPEFERMMKDCCDGKIDVVITKDLSRISRNICDSLDALEQFKKYGVKLMLEIG